MTPDRMSECLVSIGWTDHKLAAILECDLLIIEEWLGGGKSIPVSVAAWLGALAAAHDGIAPPSTWKKGRRLGR